MKYRDENGVFQDLYLPPTGDTLPIGAIVEYDGNTIPYGWEDVGDGKIKKTAQAIGVTGTVASEYTEDNKAVYNAPYLNNNIPNAKIGWINPNPNKAMSETTITLNDDDWDMYEILYKLVYNSTQTSSSKSIKGNGCFLHCNAAGMIFRRFVIYNSQTSLTISSENGGQNNNNQIIPIAVILYKTGLF